MEKKLSDLPISDLIEGLHKGEITAKDVLELDNIIEKASNYDISIIANLVEVLGIHREDYLTSINTSLSKKGLKNEITLLFVYSSYKKTSLY